MTTPMEKPAAATTKYRRRPRTRWLVPAEIAIVAIVILAAFVALAFKRQAEDRGTVIYRTTLVACQAQNEFRQYQADYLTRQIGRPVTEMPGFDRLDPGLQNVIRSIAPLLDAGRAQRAAAAETFKQKFPVRDCDMLAAEARRGHPRG